MTRVPVSRGPSSAAWSRRNARREGGRPRRTHASPSPINRSPRRRDTRCVGEGPESEEPTKIRVAKPRRKREVLCGFADPRHEDDAQPAQDRRRDPKPAGDEAPTSPGPAATGRRRYPRFNRLHRP